MSLIKRLFFTGSLFCALYLPSQAVVVSNFGTGFAPTLLAGDWLDQNAVSDSVAFSSVTAPAQDGGSFIASVAVPNLSGFDSISVTARTDVGNTAAGFIVTLYTGLSDYAFASFSTANFTSNFSTVTRSFTVVGAYDPTNIIAFGISGGQPFGIAAFRMSFDSVEAITAPVPEPSTWAFGAGIAAVGYSVCRRRRASVKVQVAA